MTTASPPATAPIRRTHPPRPLEDPRRALPHRVRHRPRRHDRQRRPARRWSASSARPTSQLQWIVDAYILVFAGLLIAAGSLGDRFGRKGVHAARPRRCSALFSALGRAQPTRPAQLIAWRAAMGIGAALIFPATLAILINVFTDAQRAGHGDRASGRRPPASPSPLGPVTGGFLLEHFWWGSVLIDQRARSWSSPCVAIGAHRADVAGHDDPPLRSGRHAWLSIAGDRRARLGDDRGARARLDVDRRASPASPSPASLLVGFVAWERRIDHPMLDVGVFTNPRFTRRQRWPITFAFFALFGFIFLVTQYFQFVRGYGTARGRGAHAAVRASSPARWRRCRARWSSRFGTKAVVTAGLRVDGGRLRRSPPRPRPSTRRTRSSSCAMFFMGGGLGLVHGAGHRVDHGLAAAGQGRRRLGGQRHDPRARRHARRRRSSAACSRRSTARASPTPWPGRRSRPRRVDAGHGVGRRGDGRRRAGRGHRRTRRAALHHRGHQRRLPRRVASRLVGVGRRRPRRGAARLALPAGPRRVGASRPPSPVATTASMSSGCDPWHI